MNTRTFLLLLVIFGVLGTGVSAQSPWRLVDNSLESRIVEVTEMTTDRITFIDAQGRAGEVSTKTVLAMVHLLPPEETRDDRDLRIFPQTHPHYFSMSPSEEATPHASLVELTDGQVWAGTLLATEGERLTWLFEDAIPLSTSIDTIASVSIGAPLARVRRTWGGIEDRVLLANGDVLDGFVASLGPDLTIEIEGKARDVSLDRVAGVLLANPPTVPDGMRVRTDLGSELAATSVAISASGTCLVRPIVAPGDAPLEELPVASVRSILLRSDGAGALSEFEPGSIEGPAGVDWGLDSLPDPALGFDHVALRGPIRVRWDLPRTPARLGATVSLPPAMWAWGDCELVVLDGGDEVFRARLSADSPSVALNVAISSRELRVEIIAGPSGPVQDRLLLEQPMITWR